MSAAESLLASAHQVHGDKISGSLFAGSSAFIATVPIWHESSRDDLGLLTGLVLGYAGSAAFNFLAPERMNMGERFGIK